MTSWASRVYRECVVGGIVTFFSFRQHEHDAAGWSRCRFCEGRSHSSGGECGGHDDVALFAKRDDCVGLEEYVYPNCLLAKAMKEGKMKLVKTSSERYRTCRCCDGGGSWTYDYETPSGLPFQVYYCYTSVTG